MLTCIAMADELKPYEDTSGIIQIPLTDRELLDHNGEFRLDFTLRELVGRLLGETLFLR